ncbi:hypothetical protein GQX73_g1012 [Xylaria multiplex]|uniref:Uncharacterized protein n=1 Tax=Xylaria multiplex TaxID=323545 RepID=A0A7C8MYI7_9PEZI|nr:hypothetical protein GQX73_g1012 [Xylaria multiplex]
MMPSVYGANLSQITPPTYTDYPIFDDFSRQQPAFPDSYRRVSRHPNGQRAPGAMRVVKPSSANNSPQTMMARRRTMMNDSNMIRRRQQALDQALLQQIQDTSPSYYMNNQDPIKQNARPVSWHPSSHIPDVQQMHMQIPQPDFNQFAMAMTTPYDARECFAGYQQLPPTPAAYSGHTSPVSSFSPLLPYDPASQSTLLPAYIAADSLVAAPQVQSNYFPSDGSPDTVERFPAYTNQPCFDWHTYAPQKLQSCTAPPTPEGFQGVPQPQSVPSEESIPYQPLEEPDNEEEEGEILVGMGLYDLPSKADSDPELDHYRTTTSRFLDTTYRSGKGWKLEEAWEPPASDDEDDEEDADGEDQGEDQETEESNSTKSPPAQQSWI